MDTISPLIQRIRNRRADDASLLIPLTLLRGHHGYIAEKDLFGDRTRLQAEHFDPSIRIITEHRKNMNDCRTKSVQQDDVDVIILQNVFKKSIIQFINR